MGKKRIKLLLTLLVLLGLYGFLEWFFSEGNYNPAPQEAPAFPHADARTPDGDSVWVRAGAHYWRTKAGRFFLGDHYRDVWVARVKAPVFKLDETSGGLTIKKLGGGMQTVSLTLTDKQGQSFALRSVDKNPTAVLPPFWQKTFVAKFVRDQISGTNPYAALVVAPLAEAAGIYHANPRLFFVLPSDSSFGQHTQLFANQLFLFEEKFNNKESIRKNLGNAIDIDDTEKVLEHVYENPEYQVDQKLFARCRLFDIWLGDWDRHEGQWEWAEYEENGINLYKPIPKDRDQAMCHYTDGVIPWLATRYYHDRKFTGFEKEYPEIEALSYNARFLDARALNSLTWSDFVLQVNYLKQHLTDAVIEKSVREFPKEVYALLGPVTAEKLKARRNNLMTAAHKYYLHLAKEVTIAATDQTELVEIEHLPEKQVRITISQLLDGAQPVRVLYSRTFYPAETEKVTVFPLGGNDVVQLSGKATEGVKVTVVVPKGVTLSDNSTGVNQAMFVPADQVPEFMRVRQREE